jgi:hypothetical protein
MKDHFLDAGRMAKLGNCAVRDIENIALTDFDAQTHKQALI